MCPIAAARAAAESSFFGALVHPALDGKSLSSADVASRGGTNACRHLARALEHEFRRVRRRGPLSTHTGTHAHLTHEPVDAFGRRRPRWLNLLRSHAGAEHAAVCRRARRQTHVAAHAWPSAVRRGGRDGGPGEEAKTTAGEVVPPSSLLDPDGARAFGRSALCRTQRTPTSTLARAVQASLADVHANDGPRTSSEEHAPGARHRRAVKRRDASACATPRRPSQVERTSPDDDAMEPAQAPRRRRTARWTVGAQSKAAKRKTTDDCAASRRAASGAAAARASSSCTPAWGRSPGVHVSHVETSKDQRSLASVLAS